MFYTSWKVILLFFFLLPGPTLRFFQQHVPACLSQQPTALAGRSNSAWLRVTASLKGASRFQGRSKSVFLLFFFPLCFSERRKGVAAKEEDWITFTPFISARSEMWKLSHSCPRAKSRSSRPFKCSSHGLEEVRVRGMFRLPSIHSQINFPERHGVAEPFQSAKSVTCCTQHRLMQRSSACGFKQTRVLHRLFLMKLIWHEKQCGCTLVV